MEGSIDRTIRYTFRVDFARDRPRKVYGKGIRLIKLSCNLP